MVISGQSQPSKRKYLKKKKKSSNLPLWNHNSTGVFLPRVVLWLGQCVHYWHGLLCLCVKLFESKEHVAQLWRNFMIKFIWVFFRGVKECKCLLSSGTLFWWVICRSVDSESVFCHQGYCLCVIRHKLTHACTFPLQAMTADFYGAMFLHTEPSSASSSTPWWSRTWRRLERRRWMSLAHLRHCRSLAGPADTTLLIRMGRSPHSGVMTLTFWKMLSADLLTPLR